MRPRFAPAALLLVFATASAPAFDRETIESGDVVTGDILVPYTFDEFPIRAVRGSILVLTVSGAAPRPMRPALGLYTDDYAIVPLLGSSPSSAASLNALSSADYRIIVGGLGGSVGAYRLKATMKPGTLFTFSGGGDVAAPQLTFGAYAGFDATVSIRWKGPSAVTLASVVGPDGATLTSAATPRSSRTSFTLGGFRASASGDHVFTLGVPAGTVKWTATVRVAGRLPPGTTRDFRTTPAPERPAISFLSFGRFPIAYVVGERGGPNDCALSSAGAVPTAAFLDGGAGAGGCSLAIGNAAQPPTAYVLGCNDGFYARVADVERYPEGHEWAGLVRSYSAPEVRSPQGSGETTLTDIAYDASGRPTGWTETRRFDASGHEHRLEFSEARYFPNGFCKAFRVVASRIVDGEPVSTSVEDYAPFR
jgi:hypothetical protein